MDKKEVFSPYDASVKHNVINCNGGINWTYANFPTYTDRDAFIAECSANGFRTRSIGEKDGVFYVQYHHYAD